MAKTGRLSFQIKDGQISKAHAEIILNYPYNALKHKTSCIKAMMKTVPFVAKRWSKTLSFECYWITLLTEKIIALDANRAQVLVWRRNVTVMPKCMSAALKHCSDPAQPVLIDCLCKQDVNVDREWRNENPKNYRDPAHRQAITASFRWNKMLIVSWTLSSRRCSKRNTANLGPPSAFADNWCYELAESWRFFCLIQAVL